MKLEKIITPLIFLVVLLGQLVPAFADSANAVSGNSSVDDISETMVTILGPPAETRNIGHLYVTVDSYDYTLVLVVLFLLAGIVAIDVAAKKYGIKINFPKISFYSIRLPSLRKYLMGFRSVPEEFVNDC